MVEVPKDKAFLAYPFTEYKNAGKLEQLELEMGRLWYLLSRNPQLNGGFCSIFHENWYQQANITTEEIYRLTQEEVTACDRFIGYIPSNVPSSGRDNEAVQADELDFPLHFIVKSAIAIAPLLPKLRKRRPLVNIITYDDLGSIEFANRIENYDFRNPDSLIKLE